MGRVCVGRLCYGPSLQWAEFAMGRDVQLPLVYMTYKISVAISVSLGTIPETSHSVLFKV